MAQTEAAFRGRLGPQSTTSPQTTMTPGILARFGPSQVTA
jgi:hypothetical protein